MIVFDVLSYDSPGLRPSDKMHVPYRYGYQKFLESQERGEVKLKKPCEEVSGSHLIDHRDHVL